MSGNYIHIIRGDTYAFSTNVCLDGVPVDLFGASLWFQAKADPELDGDESLIVNASTANGEITVSGNNNSVVTISLNSIVTENYTDANVMHWALRAQLLSGSVFTLDRGLGCVVNPTVHNPY